jgi:cathepsin F/cysteine peptidase B
MKVAIVVVFAALVAVAVASSVEDDKRLFADYMHTFGRTYAPAEEAHRFQCFRQNLVIIAERNAAGKGQETHGINQFTDLCPKEFAKYYLGLRPSNATKAAVPALFNKAELAGACSSIDWRTKGVVTPIKNQGQCGSCWSFSATGNMEGQWAKAGHSLVSLSEEELVQCSASAGNMGCNGGLMDQAFEWVASNGGINSEAAYPYTSGGGVTGTCIRSKLAGKVAAFPSHKDLPNSENQMAAWACTGGPIAIGVDATSWQTYTGGIMTNCQGTQMDHGVLIVGFDATNSPPYWTIKNSWGVSWGESGYIRVAMGSDQCGLTQAPSTSIAGTPGPGPAPSGDATQSEM